MDAGILRAVDEAELRRIARAEYKHSCFTDSKAVLTAV